MVSGERFHQSDHGRLGSGVGASRGPGRHNLRRFMSGLGSLPPLALPPRVHTRADHHGEKYQYQRPQRGKPPSAIGAHHLPLLQARQFDRLGAWSCRGRGFYQSRSVTGRRRRLQQLAHGTSHFLFVQADQAGVLAHPASREYVTGQLGKIVGFNGFEKALGNLKLLGNPLQAEVVFQTLPAQRIADGCHNGSALYLPFIIQNRDVRGPEGLKSGKSR